MVVDIDIWQVISLLITLIGAFWGIAKMMLSQSARALDEKFAQISRRLDAQEESDRRSERQMSDMRAELPREYVRRDDFVRAISGFDVRVDQLRLTIERAMYERDRK